MPTTIVTFDNVRKIGLALPGVEEATAYGSPALKVHGSLLACLPVNKSAEPGSFALAMDFERRSGLIADAPETFYVTPHYLDHPIVLVRLSRIRVEQLPDLLSSAWRFVTAHAGRAATRPDRAKPNRSKGNSRRP
jgi:hypothetical protein